MMDILLVMNPQNSFFSPDGAVYMGEKADIIKIRLIDYFSGFSNPIIFFREKHALDDTFFITDKTHSIANTSDSEIYEPLKKYASSFYDKTRYSAFYGTPLEMLLKQKGIKGVGLVGVETHTSILFTAEELRNRGYEVTIIEPLIASRDNFMHNSALSLMVNFLGIRMSNG